VHAKHPLPLQVMERREEVEVDAFTLRARREKQADKKVYNYMWQLLQSEACDSPALQVTESKDLRIVQLLYAPDDFVLDLLVFVGAFDLFSLFFLSPRLRGLAWCVEAVSLLLQCTCTWHLELLVTCVWHVPAQVSSPGSMTPCTCAECLGSGQHGAARFQDA
jgi:hypothetical protein